VVLTVYAPDSGLEAILVKTVEDVGRKPGGTWPVYAAGLSALGSRLPRTTILPCVLPVPQLTRSP